MSVSSYYTIRSRFTSRYFTCKVGVWGMPSMCLRYIKWAFRYIRLGFEIYHVSIWGFIK